MIENIQDFDLIRIQTEVMFLAVLANAFANVMKNIHADWMKGSVLLIREIITETDRTYVAPLPETLQQAVESIIVIITIIIKIII